MPISAAKIQALTNVAKKVARRAYAPYSQFRVGAAVVGRSGKIAAGCNVENASYGLTCCAERNAVFQLVAQGEIAIRAIAIYTPTETPTAPCGACRQVLNEFGPEMMVVSVCDGSERIETSLSELLPGAFGPKNLEIT
jgi:cytidine deaminase